MNKTDNKELRLIQGGHHYDVSHGPYRIVAAPEGKPPFNVDAVVAEEDTFLVMSAQPVVRVPKEPLMKVMTRLIETKPKEPGTILVKGKDPHRILAIVHDFNEEPTWREEWIESALEAVFQEAENRKLESIALPMLGTKHGSLEEKRFLALLRSVLDRTSFPHPKRIWLVIPPGTSLDTLETFKLNRTQISTDTHR